MPDENSDNCWSFSPDDSLGPRTDAAINEFQREMLDEALSSDYVMNIAISGPFGSGKSTFIKSYEAQRKRAMKTKNPLRISLLPSLNTAVKDMKTKLYRAAQPVGSQTSMSKKGFLKKRSSIR